MNQELADLLDALADDDVARRAARQTQCLRGIRGVPMGDVARVVSELWTVDPTQLPRDTADLNQAFVTAFEDGLVAIGLLATTAADAPDAALDLALDWGERTDDVTTADALGWLLLAPTVLLTGRYGEVHERLGIHRRPETRRCAVSMGLGLTPTPVEGPSAAGLRAKHDHRSIRLVDRAQSAHLAPLCDRFVRDDVPLVQKALRRVLRSWSNDDPSAVAAWGSRVRGGLPKLLRDEVRRARRLEAR